MFSEKETERYSRQLILKGFGGDAQKKLKQARVLVVGAGGLGSPVIAYLAAAGVGHLTIIDNDRVELSNLQRQIVHTNGQIGVEKSISGAQFASGLNDDISVKTIVGRLEKDNGKPIIADHDLVVDGTDRFSTRASIAALCEEEKRTLVSGAVSMFDGQVSVFAPHLKDRNGKPNPGFSCLYPHLPDDADLPACEVNGIIGATTGVIGTLMAMEAIKIITGTGEPLIGRLLLYDGRNARFSDLKYKRT